MVSPACDADTLPATNTRTNTNPSIEREDRHSCFMARTRGGGSQCLGMVKAVGRDCSTRNPSKSLLTRRVVGYFEVAHHPREVSQ